MLLNTIHKTTLANGLTILCVPRHDVPKVCLELWYNVGSKDEQSGQKGIAHLIEHMIFKGTDTLSESDINTIAHKLSAYINAFTSYDYTGYLFDIPSQHWDVALGIMADCMRNCTFKQEHLNSELKAVIQELKMYNDEYVSTLAERMISAIFRDHPYHHPIIGYKQDLWGLKRDALVGFYKKHYVPNNATLIAVGDVKPEELRAAAEKAFGAIPADDTYKKESFYHGVDLGSVDVTLYRDVQQPIVLLAWAIPGLKERIDYQLDILSWVLGSGKGARLYAQLVDELELATEVESFVDSMTDCGLFFIYVQPRDMKQIDLIISHVHRILSELAQEHISDKELQRAVRKTESDFMNMLESNQKQASLIGKYFLATGDEKYVFEYCDYPQQNIKEELRVLVGQYLRPSLTARGMVLPLDKKDVDYWHFVQGRSDEEDARILGGIERTDAVEEPSHAHTIHAKAPAPFAMPWYETFTLRNGLKVLMLHRPQLPKIDLIVDFATKPYMDPEDMQGRLFFAADASQEGTERYTAQEFGHEIESLGMELSVGPGQISMTMLSTDVRRGLELLRDLVENAAFRDADIERARAKILGELAIFWDSPTQYIGQLMRETIYGNHPYHKNIMGTVESIQKMTREDLVAAYKAYSTPHGTRISIVGDLSGCNVQELLEEMLGSWNGPEPITVEFPHVAPKTAHVINHPATRDQITLAFGGISIPRSDPRFDALLLFDQILTGGALRSMSSRLFDLRERTGLFYTIGGSVLAGADKQPGMVYIKTIVSQDRLAEAEQAVLGVLKQGAADITDQELEEARNAVWHAIVDYFATNRQCASTFLFADQFDLSREFFMDRAKSLASITKEQVKDAVEQVLRPEELITLRVGRI